MNLTLVDLCWDNVPTVSSEASDVIFTISADTSGDSASAATANTAATTVSGCTITKTMEIFDTAANDWVDFVHSGGAVPNASYPWINAQDSSDGSISILDDNTNNDYDDLLETVFNLRWKNMDLRSKADGNILYDYFDVTIKWQCHLNTVVIGNSGNGVIDWSYELDNSVVAKAASYTELSAACPTDVSITCEYMADDDQFTNGSQLDYDNWMPVGAEVTTCDLATGFEVTKDNTGPGMFNNQPEQFVNYRIKYIVPDSLLTEDTGKFAYDYFTVRFHTPCADLTVSTTTDLGDVTYLVKSTSTETTYAP